jgi:hypothetical protein
MKKHNFYIKILEYGKDHLEGFNYSEIKEGLKEKLERELQKEEIVILEKYLRRANENERGIDNIFRETMFISLRDDRFSEFNQNNVKYIINFEAFSKYIDYIELKEARKYSRESLKYAEKSLRKAEESLKYAGKSLKISKIIIWISIGSFIISAIVSIYFSAIQIKTPIEINKEQFNQMLEVKK